MSNTPPSEPPPPYSASSAGSAKNEIPLERRRSMEDELRPLPPNWVRQFDKTSNHQFFVDTSAEPPRSIWQHPYDDEEYLSTLSPKERSEIARLHQTTSTHDAKQNPAAEDYSTTSSSSSATAAAPLEPAPTGLHKLGRKMKDRLTHTTHEQRTAERRQRAEEEEAAYRAHVALRAAAVRAAETGQPQRLGRDAAGRDVYVEPPSGPGAYGYGYGYNPYAQGPYADPNARFVRPAQPYSAQAGAGYGGGLGVPLLGGLLGGVLLGELLF